MTAVDRSASPRPERSYALTSGPDGSALTIAEEAIRRPGALDQRSGPEPATRWTRPRRPRPGWHAYRPDAAALMPDWAVEIAVTVERPFASCGDTAPARRALLLARAAGPWSQVARAVAAAMREVDSLAGVGPPIPRLRLVQPLREAGLDPLSRLDVLAHLRGAGERGRAVGHRRRRTHEAGIVAWQPGAGAVVTCTGRVGVSAQAVIAIEGHGDPRPLRPPAGGAVVLRAWRCRRGRNHQASLAEPDTDWALTAGIVLASSSGGGLGRSARRHAVLVQDAGWDATLLTGAAALVLARAGDPRYPPPRATARHASRHAVAEMLMSFLTAAADQAAYPALSGDEHQRP